MKLIFKKIHLFLTIFLCCILSVSAYSSTLGANGTIPSDKGFHELIFISNGTRSVDANEDGVIDIAETALDSANCEDINCTLNEWDIYENKINFKDSPIWINSWVASPTKAVLELISGNRVEDEIMLGGDGTGGDYKTGLIKLQADNTKIYGNLNVSGDLHIGMSSMSYDSVTDLLKVGALKLTGPDAPLSCNVAVNASGDFKCETGLLSGWIIHSNGNDIYSALMGNVGIGTNLPMYKLHVVGDTNIEGDIYGDDIYGDNIEVDNLVVNNNLDVTNVNVTNINVEGDTNIGGTIYGDDIVVNQINVTNLDVTNVNVENIYKGGDLFVAGYWNQTGTDIWYIDGEVGIGTTSPNGAKLVVAKDQNPPFPACCDDSAAIIITGESNPNQRLQLGYDTNDNYGWIRAAELGVNIRDVIIQPDGGSVGIGKIGPSEKLDVQGNIKASGIVCDSNGCIEPLPNCAQDQIIKYNSGTSRWECIDAGARSCPAGKAVQGINADNSLVCVDVCSPDCSCSINTCLGNTCNDGCGGTCGGTKIDGACCVDSTWSPATSTVCSGVSFTQTSNCGTTRTATGTKACGGPTYVDSNVNPIAGCTYLGLRQPCPSSISDNYCHMCPGDYTFVDSNVNPISGCTYIGLRQPCPSTASGNYCHICPGSTYTFIDTNVNPVSGWTYIGLRQPCPSTASGNYCQIRSGSDYTFVDTNVNPVSGCTYIGLRQPCPSSASDNYCQVCPGSYNFIDSNQNPIAGCTYIGLRQPCPSTASSNYCHICPI